MSAGWRSIPLRWYLGRIGVGAVSPPVAAFIGTPLSGYRPLSVQFTDNSTGSPSSWSWLATGQNTSTVYTSTVQNPLITFAVPDVYNVELMVSNAAGSDAITKLGYVTVSASPPPIPPVPPRPLYPPESTPFSRISAAIRNRLASYCQIDPALVQIVANENYRVTLSEPMFLYVQFMRIEAFGDTGGGRRNPWAYRRFRVYIYTRAGVDSYGSDQVALQGNGALPDPYASPYGQFVAEEAVIGALFNWMPVDQYNKALCQEPIHPMDDASPPIRTRENDAGFVRTNLDFQIRYGLYITVNDPPS